MRSLTLAIALLLHFFFFEGGAASPFHAKRFKKTKYEGQSYWNTLAQRELQEALNVQWNTNVAKNVILFLGDGMSIPTLTASRIYKGQKKLRGGEEGSLVFENFPHVGLSKTYNVDKQVPDSAGTGTAYLTGVKTNYKTIGVDASVKYNDCKTVNEKNKVYSIVKWAQDAGKRTGVVTSTRVTHATPAATYAHVANRDWECDGAFRPEDTQKCPDMKDIARQLVEDEPGMSINVVMGGGNQNLNASAVGTIEDPLDDQWAHCERKDGRDLTKTWIDKKTEQKVNWSFVRRKSELQKVNLATTEYLLGLFSNGHVPWEHEKVDRKLDVPTLAEMTEAAIQILQQEPKGFFLLVEGGRIDHAHHDGTAHRALDETVAFDAAVNRALRLTSQEDTLIVVTADHAHTMSMSGYPARGQEITGLAALGADGLPYTTLMYANGPGYNYSVVHEDGAEDKLEVSRPHLTQIDATAWEYTQLAAVPRSSETHGGDDVAIYALGPMAHLFHSLHEQNYIAHVMAYASCVGTNLDHCGGGAAAQIAALPGLVLVLISVTLSRLWS